MMAQQEQQQHSSSVDPTTMVMAGSSNGTTTVTIPSGIGVVLPVLVGVGTGTSHPPTTTVCPYGENHVVKFENGAWLAHDIGFCRKFYKFMNEVWEEECDIKICPYDPTHHVHKDVLVKHVQLCQGFFKWSAENQKEPASMTPGDPRYWIGGGSGKAKKKKKVLKPGQKFTKKVNPKAVKTYCTTDDEEFFEKEVKKAWERQRAVKANTPAPPPPVDCRGGYDGERLIHTLKQLPKLTEQDHLVRVCKYVENHIIWRNYDIQLHGPWPYQDFPYGHDHKFDEYRYEFGSGETSEEDSDYFVNDYYKND